MIPFWYLECAPSCYLEKSFIISASKIIINFAFWAVSAWAQMRLRFVARHTCLGVLWFFLPKDWPVEVVLALFLHTLPLLTVKSATTPSQHYNLASVSDPGTGRRYWGPAFCDIIPSTWQSSLPLHVSEINLAKPSSLAICSTHWPHRFA